MEKFLTLIGRIVLSPLILIGYLVAAFLIWIGWVLTGFNIMSIKDPDDYDDYGNKIEKHTEIAVKEPEECNCHGDCLTSC